MWPGIIPNIDLPGLIIPAQLGPTKVIFSFLEYLRIYLLILIMSCEGIPSTIATHVLIPASAASIAESAAKAGGTNKIDAVAPVCLTASFTVLNTGLSKCFWPPFPGVTPPTRLDPYFIISSAWKVPIFPVNP